MNKYLLILVLIIFSIDVKAQSAFVPVNKHYQHLLNRYEIKSGKFYSNIHTSTQPFSRRNIIHSFDSVNIDKITNSKSDTFNINYIKNDNWEWDSTGTSNSQKPFLKYFYQKKNALYHKKNKDLMLQINPVLRIKAGKSNNNEDFLYTNTRGVELRGSIDNKVGFYTFATDNQAFYPKYINRRINKTEAVPGANFNKKFKKTGYDYFNIRGYITLNATEHIGIQFGHDRHFIGNGYRSLILSDYAGSYLFLKANTNIWRFQYTNLFAQMTGDISGNGNTLFPKKYLALHHLSYNVTDNFNIGLFESIIFGREDSLSKGNFDISYLNPVIFYRAVESNLGSKDNALLGMDFKWNFLQHYSLYGQLVLDEFLLNNIKKGNGWWANKYGIQGGFKYIDVLNISNLDIQAEGNIVRPFTYAHRSDYTNHTHFHQPLAHPLGSNFREIIGIIRYQPFSRFKISARYLNIKQGQDPQGKNLGNNILKDYTTHSKDYNNTMFQGLKSTIHLYNLTLSCQLKHNFFIDLNYMYRKEINKKFGNSLLHYPSIGIRWNVGKKELEF